MTWNKCSIFTVQSLLSSSLFLTLSKRDCSSKLWLNHYKQIRMIFAESFTNTSEKLLSPLLHFWLFSMNHGSFPTSWDPGPLSLAAMFPYTRPQLCSMEFLFRLAITHAKMEITGRSLLASLFPSLHTFTENLCSKSVHTNLQVENFQACKSAFACAIKTVSSQI